MRCANRLQHEETCPGISEVPVGHAMATTLFFNAADDHLRVTPTAINTKAALSVLHSTGFRQAYAGVACDDGRHYLGFR